MDRAARRPGLSPSAFARRAFAAALERLRVQELERRPRRRVPPASRCALASSICGPLSRCGPT